MYQDPESPVIERYFIDLGDRQVHYRLAGSGPPLLLLHQSPASSAEMATELEVFADEFTVIAPDTPGFGLSDPLADVSGDVSLHLTHFVRALEEFLSALGIEKTLIYGFHTGAMLGFEFARLYPERCAAVIVNGLVVCEPAELADLLRNYNVMPSVTEEGAHLAWMWARMRDQLIFFPWYRKERDARMHFDMPDPGYINDHLIDFLRAQEGGRVAYQAAFAYPTRDHIADIRAPVYLLNYRQDPLAGHPERLEKIPAGMPREIFPGPAELHERVVGILRERAPGPARLLHASDGALRGASSGELDVERARELRSEIVNTDVGPVFVRCSVSGNEPAVILLHDAGSSSRSLEPVARGLAGGRKVILIDLPGHGETGALHLRDYSAERLAGLAVDVMNGLAIRSASVVALGAAGAIAVAMARANSGANSGVDSGAKMIRDLVLIDPWLFEPVDYDRMIADYVPELRPQAFGQHLLAAWYCARDSELYWPWHAPLTANELTRTPEIAASQTQDRTTDIIKAGAEFRRLVRDLLAYDLAGSLTSMESFGAQNIRVAARSGNGHQARAEKAAGLAGASYAVLPEGLGDWAPELDKCLS